MHVIECDGCPTNHSTHEVSMSVTYARFSNYSVAHRASQLLRDEIGETGRVQVLHSARKLSHHTIPLHMTAVRVGALFGGAVVALLSLIAAGTCLWAMTSSGQPIPAAAETLAVCVGLSTLLGCLAGALSFASDSTATVRRMHDWLDMGKPVVLIETNRGHELTMRQLGADVVGRIV
jgi:hypothetical protein